MAWKCVKVMVLLCSCNTFPAFAALSLSNGDEYSSLSLFAGKSQIPVVQFLQERFLWKAEIADQLASLRELKQPLFVQS